MQNNLTDSKTLYSWTLFGIYFAYLFVVTFVDPAFAQESDPFATASNKAAASFQGIKKIVLIIGGIGVLGIAVSAFFGKFKWYWLASLVGGLVLVLIVGEMVEYFAGDAAALE